MIKEISLKTKFKNDFQEITEQVKEVVRESGVESGICYIYNPHTTAGVFINENADPDVTGDVIYSLYNLIPWENNYKHQEGNSAAHIKSILVGSSCTVFIENSELILGTWQGIFFAEFDGPRNRKILIKII